MAFISIDGLAAELQGAQPVVCSMCDESRPALCRGSKFLAVWRNPRFGWIGKTNFDHPTVLLYCVHGHEISQDLAATLRAMGVDALSLSGGFSAWYAAGRALQRIESDADSP